MAKRKITACEAKRLLGIDFADNFYKLSWDDKHAVLSAARRLPQTKGCAGINSAYVLSVFVPKKRVLR